MNPTDITAWVIVGLGVLIIAWVSWRHISSHRDLDKRLADGDEKILTDERYVVNEVMQAPIGSGVLPYTLVQQVPARQPISRIDSNIPQP